MNFPAKILTCNRVSVEIFLAIAMNGQGNILMIVKYSHAQNNKYMESILTSVFVCFLNMHSHY